MQNQNRLVLPALCDRGAAEALLPEMIAAIGTGRIEIDASATTRLGQAMLQILVSARQTDGGATIIASAEVIETARLCGLDRVLFDEVLP
jgi:anti-anti-sigma regulatory factor